MAQCIICWEQLHLAEISALHCGHTFHLQCITSWTKENKTCPVCRVRVTSKQLIKQLFFDLEDENMGIVSLTHIEEMVKQLTNLEAELQQTRQQNAELKKQLRLHTTKGSTTEIEMGNKRGSASSAVRNRGVLRETTSWNQKRTSNDVENMTPAKKKRSARVGARKGSKSNS